MDVMGRFPNDAPASPFCHPGDIYFTRSTALLGRAIRWAETDKGESNAWANHVGGVTSYGYLIPPTDAQAGEHQLAMVSEALWHIKHHFFWDHYKNQQGTAVAVFRPTYVSAEQKNVMITDWLSRTGQRYGWWRLFTFLGEKLTAGIIPFSRLHFQDTRVVCSNHIGLGAEKINMWLGDQPNMLDPDEAMDFMESDKKHFEFIGWSIIPGRHPLG